jgi:hypothetical protein
MHKVNPMNDGWGRHQGDNDLGETIERSIATLLSRGSSKLRGIHILLLEIGRDGLPAANLGKLARNDKLARLWTRGRPDMFRGNETTVFLNDEVASSGVDDSHTGFKRRRNPPKW